MIISLLHPFTPQAAGVVEPSVATYHSQPHLKAMQQLMQEHENITCTVDYFTPKFRRYHYCFQAVDYRFYPVQLTWSGDHKKWKKQYSKPCLKAYKRETPDVTIINMSGHSSPFSHELAQIILKAGKQYIAMLGGQHYTDTPDNRQYYKRAHHVLVHTQLQKDMMQQMPMFEGLDIRVFPLGVDTTVFKPLPHDLNLNPKLLYVGRIVGLKQIHLAIEALHEVVTNGFDYATLTIIGPVSSESYYQQLQQRVRALHLETQVLFLGHKEHEALPRYFQEADLLLLPSDKETFGMVMVEAMACGTPVAALNCSGGPADVIAHGINGLLGTENTYAGMVCGYFMNADKQNAMRIAAREKAVKDYSLEKTYEVLLQCIKDVMGNKL
ncbi:glycosyltransferase family 4 protein [Gaetbulibacter saemankumensis]|uniref:glycosyltransferase family 4 protein n=1 Tax=Gaetbulibacter saemankumensis TaxID=311208 RepID=UPI0004159498|nr:glycosyltransferase family 4 protein [Gaetbulibacter saemankumensis]